MGAVSDLQCAGLGGRSRGSCVSEICMSCVFLKILHGSLDNRNTDKDANVDCPKDNKTAM